MMNTILLAIGLVLIVEGLGPLFAPKDGAIWLVN